MAIADKAQELGHLIGQGEEYRALQRAREALSGNSGLGEKLERLEALASRLERMVVEGQQPEATDEAEYERLFGEVQADSGYQAVVTAQSNFDKLMLRVQEQILEGMRTGAESRIITLS